MSDKRSGSRSKSFLKGQIVFNNRMSTMDCTIRNLSSRGAKLAVAQSLALPDLFELVIPQKGETFRARLQWRREDEIGISFVPASAAGDAGARVRELEAEVQALREQLAAAEARLGREPLAPAA